MLSENLGSNYNAKKWNERFAVCCKLNEDDYKLIGIRRSVDIHDNQIMEECRFVWIRGNGDQVVRATKTGTDIILRI